MSYENIKRTKLDNVTSASLHLSRQASLIFFLTKKQFSVHYFTINEKNSEVVISLEGESINSPYATKSVATYSKELVEPFEKGCDAYAMTVYNSSKSGHFRLPDYMSFLCVTGDGFIYYLHRQTKDVYKVRFIYSNFMFIHCNFHTDEPN